MFTTGQLIFGVLFFIVFVIAVAFQYRKDKTIRNIHYRGSIWILIAFIGFIAMIAAVKFLFI
ncbi:hypothetical protein [uncultured Winogradskyella sp.]|uniref:hypothetical protein n=1 Tax=uncultured Winogradskyella sp. TaxID=395353 RepID=UPI00261FE4CA|nr:hypothetical protein [uncultured Winogradskyella sp.]